MTDAFLEAQDIFGAVPVVQRKRVEGGTYVATLYGIADLGTQTKTDKKSGEQYTERILKLSFELPTEMADFGKGKQEPLSIHDQFVKFELKPNSKSQRVTLYKYAAALIGLTQETISQFRVDQMIGKSCSLEIDASGEYENIANVSALMKGFNAPKMINKPIKYSIIADGFESDAFKSLNKGARRTIIGSQEFLDWSKDNRVQAEEIKKDCAK